MNINLVPDNIDILGVLPSYDYSQDHFDKENIFMNRSGVMHCVIKPVSEMPESITAAFFIAYPNNLAAFEFTDDIKLSDDSRKQHSLNYFDDKLLIFRPIRRGRSENFGLESVRAVVAKPKNFDETKTYVSVPVYSNQTHVELTYDILLDRLLHEKYLGPISGIANDAVNTPRFIFWRENNFTYKVLGIFREHTYGRNGFQFKLNHLKSIDFKEEWFNSVIKYEANPTMVFIEKELHEFLFDQLSEAPEVTPPNVEIQGNDPESVFIQEFIDFTKQKGFVYAPKDLINFHTAMKSSTLTILSGISGIGKSRIVALYGQALGIPDENIRIIPVRPSWNDDADLIGFVDSIHMVYRPGDCGVIDTLVAASLESEKDNLYLICFDEMNLARVEHYFSQFLSVLEMDPSRRYLRLYNEEMENRLYNATKYPATIKINDNVLFVGTVNIDESTHHFSDKVLDRANVIKLHVEDFDKLKSVGQENASHPIDIGGGILYEFKDFRKLDRDIVMPDREISLLKDLNNCLHESGNGLGFGPRVVKQIFRYLTNLPKDSLLKREEALDLQIVQRILTKVKGPEDRLKTILGEFNIKTGTVDGGTIYSVLESYNDVSEFTETRKELKFKARELKSYGYTL